LSFDLRDILAVIGEPVRKSRWRCYDLWFTAKRNEKFSEFRESRLKLTGDELMQFAFEIHQTIDGRFEATGEGAAKKPWLVIKAVDSSWFEVWTSKPKIIEKLKERFQIVNEISIGSSQSVVQKVVS
jgi:hypothetical protein